MKWGNKALMRFQGFSFRRRSERSFCERPHLQQSNWHTDAPRRFPKAAHMKGPYSEGLDMCQTGMRDIFMVTEPAMFQFNRQGFGSLWWHKAALHLSWALERKAVSQERSQVFGPDRTLHYSPFCFFAAKWVQTEKRNPLPTSYRVSPQVTHAQSIFMIIIVISSPAWFFPFSSSYGPVESQGDGVRVYHPHTPFTPPPMQTHQTVTPGILLTPESHTF